MRLKHLALQGYKSFATRTEFQFSEGITAIVGPNGSGKSNVADAIRWAMGEQSMLALRGRSTADMIFSGGTSRARAGMAEVSLTFDNSDGWLPVDFVEVVLTRRAYRSGENEYLLNGARIRRRDLADILSKSGLGRSRYVVVGQGLVDAALALRPQERRALFEEAAGIALYRSRREVTLERLSETERNLERVGDIMSEIAPRLRRLESEARREREREQISEQLNQLRRKWYGYQWGRSQATLGPARQRAAALASELASKEGQLAAILEELALSRPRHDELRSALRDWRRLDAGFREKRSSLDRDLAVAEERSRLTSVQRAELVEELAHLEAQEEEQAAAIRDLAGDVSRLEHEYEDRSASLAHMDARWQHLRGEASAASERFSDAARKLKDGRNRLGALDEEIQASLAEAAQVAREQAAAMERAQRLRARHEASLAEISRVYEAIGIQRSKTIEARSSVDEHERKLRERTQHQRACERETAARVSRTDAPSSTLTRHDRDLEERRQQLAKLEEDLTAAGDLAARLQGEIDGLQQLRQGGDARQAALSAIAAAGAQGVRGPISGLVTVAAEWERAVEVGMGDLLDAVVIDSISEVDTIIRAVQVVKGHAIVLPLDALRTPPALPADALSAADVASHDPAILPAIAALFGPVALCDDVDHARRLLPSMPSGSRCATRDGIVLRADGALSVGQVIVDGTLTVERRRNSLARRRAAAIETRESLRQRRQQLAADISQTGAMAAETRRQAATARDDAERSDRELLSRAQSETALAEQALRARREALERELALAQDYQVQLTSLEAKANQALAQAEAIDIGAGSHGFATSRPAADPDTGAPEATVGTTGAGSQDPRVETLIGKREEAAGIVAAMESVLDALTGEQATARSEADEFERAHRANARTQVAVADEALRSARSALSRERVTRQRLRTRRADLLARMRQLDAGREPLAVRIDSLQTDARRLDGTLEDLRQRMVAAEGEVARLDVTLRDLEEKEHRVETQVREAEGRSQQSLLDVERTENRLRSLAQRIEQDLGLVDISLSDSVTSQSPLPLRPLVSDLPVVEELPAGLEEEIQRLRARERRYHGVNPNALSEYEEARDRSQFLADQSGDLRTASTELRRAVSELDQLMASAFWETFEEVAAEFAATFPVLFGGGSAHLELTEPDDLLGTGVDVLARPPGKRGQRLAMLSGGERALTATALLFSLLKVSPTPFCVLDEVDATLDEANAGRFRVLLDSRARETQFVVITHNRVTIEAADTIYGVSMGGEGVSQVLSMKLE